MTDYNDGNWHGWNGGECPVHILSIVERIAVSPSGNVSKACLEAGQAYWCGDNAPKGGYVVVAFRVTKEHKEPREFWMGYNWQAYRSEADAAVSLGSSGEKPIHVREVTK